MEIVASQSGDFARDKGRQVAETLLQAHPEATVIYAHNDEMAHRRHLGARGGRQGPGQGRASSSRSTATKDALKAIVDGKMGATVECNPSFGPKAMDADRALRQGRDARSPGS